MSRMPGTETVDVTTDTETNTPQKPDTREWTMMFYFASDNSLASTIVGQLKALKDARFHPQVNVVAHFDPHVVNTPSQVFDINLVEKLCPLPKSDEQKNGFRHLDPFVPNLALDKLPAPGEGEIRRIISEHVAGLQEARKSPGPRVKYDPPLPTDDLITESSPSKSLRAFLKFCSDHYPARHYMLVILGHGEIIGNQTFLSDDFANTEHFMSLTELGTIVGEFPAKLDMIAFHSCSMSSVEVAFELAGKAKYMLASQGPAYVGSWPYRSLLIRLFNDMDRNPGKAFGDDDIKRMFLKMFKYCFFNNQDFQMAGYSFDISMLDLDKVDVARNAITNLAHELGSALTSPDKPIVKDLIRLAHLDAQSYSGESYTDLYDFCWRLEWLCEDSPQHTEVVNRIKAVCKKTRMALRSYRRGDQENDNTLVVSSAFIGAAVQYSHGLSVLFPWTEPLTNWTKEYFVSKFHAGSKPDGSNNDGTKWGDFLKIYFKETMRDTRAIEFSNPRFRDKEDIQDQSLGGRLIKLMTEGSIHENGNGNGHSPTTEIFGQIGELPMPGPDNTLGKRGPDDPMGKRGPDDPTGLSCDCGTIKNYPRNT